MTRPSRLMRILWSASFANLLFLPIWRVVLYGKYYRYFAAARDRQLDCAGAMLCVAATTGIAYWLIGRIGDVTRRPIRFASLAAAGVLTGVLLNGLRLVAGLSLHSAQSLGILGLATAAIGLAIWLSPRRAGVAALWLLTILSPYVAVTFGNAVVKIATSQPPKDAGSHAPAQTSSTASHAKMDTKVRVVWVVFDEWDQSVLFERRPAGLALPNLERVKAIGVTMTHAYPPAGTTMESLPGLLTGQIVTAARIQNDAELLFRTDSRRGWQDFRASDSVVTDALDAGDAVTIYGWYHPYDLLFARHPCLRAESWPLPATEGFGGRGLVNRAVAQAKYVARLGNRRSLQRDLFGDFHDRALRAVADPTQQLMFLHYGIPHNPGIYDAVRNRLTSSIMSPSEGYIANLALVDRCMGEILTAIANAGLDGRTSVLFTSDHWWHRAPWVGSPEGYRVPLIIVARGGHQPMVNDTVICTSALRELAIEMLRGELGDNTAVAARINRARTSVPTHYRPNTVETDD